MENLQSLTKITPESSQAAGAVHLDDKACFSSLSQRSCSTQPKATHSPLPIHAYSALLAHNGCFKWNNLFKAGANGLLFNMNTLGYLYYIDQYEQPNSCSVVQASVINFEAKLTVLEMPSGLFGGFEVSH